MQKKSAKKILIAIFFLTFACTKPKDPYVLSHIPHIQLLEKQDHQSCVALRLNFDKADNLHSELYWRCRLSFAKYRLSVDPVTPQQINSNIEINDLITKISLKLADSSETILSRENKKMDNRHHQQCLRMGFVIETEDQAKIDDYFSCRKALIEDQQLVPAYGNTDYLTHQNYSYNLGFVIDQRINLAIQRFNEMNKKYPTCVKYNLYSENFQKCIAAQDESRQCFTQIERKKFQKDGEEKISCQKESYVRFNNEMLKDEYRTQQEIEKANRDSAFYNKQNFASIGIDGALFASQPKKTEEEEEKERQEKIRKINSKAGLYSKFELTRLRQKYIFSCQKEVAEEIEKFAADLKKHCEDLANFKPAEE